METISPDEYRKLTQAKPKRRKAKVERPRSAPLKVECGVCHTAIQYAAQPTKCASWGMVKIGGAWVAVHHTCYYTKREAA